MFSKTRLSYSKFIIDLNKTLTNKIKWGCQCKLYYLPLKTILN